MKKYIDKKLFAILLGYMAAYHVIYISRRTILKAIGRPEYFEVSWWRTAFEPVLANFIIVPPIIILILIATKIMIDRNMKWTRVVILHFLFSFVYILIITAFSHLYEYIFLGVAVFERTFEEFLVRAMFGSNLNFLGYVGFVTIIYSYYYIQRISQSEIQKLQLARQLQDAKMQALKSQLNPHFLFNTLNSISSLIREDAHKAQHTIGNLGDLLREVLLVKDENRIPVRKEMVILNKYLEIMQTRFSDHLIVEKKVDEEVLDALIPSMLLQPILENSFEHGYSYESTHLKVSLSISRINDWLQIQISNNGSPIKGKSTSKGLGIPNVQERLEMMFKNRYTFSFTNVEGEKGVITKISIPFQLAK